MIEANKSKSDLLFDEWASWEAPFGDSWNNFVSFKQIML